MKKQYKFIAMLEVENENGEFDLVDPAFIKSIKMPKVHYVDSWSRCCEPISVDVIDFVDSENINSLINKYFGVNKVVPSKAKLQIHYLNENGNILETWTINDLLISSIETSSLDYSNDNACFYRLGLRHIYPKASIKIERFNEKEKPLNQDLDATRWAKEFMKVMKEKKPTLDEDLMLGWFANAIMCGFDEANKRNENKQNDGE